MEEYYSVREELYDISSYLQLSKDLVVFSSSSWYKTCNAINRLKTFLMENGLSILAEKELLPSSKVYSDVCNEFNNYILKDKDSNLYVVPYLLMTIYNAESRPVTNILFETIEIKGKGNIFYCNSAFLRLHRNINWIYLMSIGDSEDIIYTRIRMRNHYCHPKDKFCLFIDDNQKTYESPSEYLKKHYTQINTLFANRSFFSIRSKYNCDLIMWDSKSSMSKLYEFVTK